MELPRSSTETRRRTSGTTVTARCTFAGHLPARRASPRPRPMITARSTPPPSARITHREQRAISGFFEKRSHRTRAGGCARRSAPKIRERSGCLSWMTHIDAPAPVPRCECLYQSRLHPRGRDCAAGFAQIHFTMRDSTDRLGPVADRYLRGTARARRGPSTEPEMRSCSGGSGRLAESGHARRVFERPAESRHARAANQVMRARRGRP